MTASRLGEPRVPGLWPILGIALLMLGAGLGLKDPWPADEPRFAMIARDMVLTGEWLFPHRAGELYPDKPPLFLWAIAALYWLTGSLRLAHALPSLLAGLGTLMLVHDLARRLWNENVARWAALALLFTVQFTLQARTAQMDALLCLWTTLGLYGLLRHLLLGPDWRWFHVACLAMGLGVITKGVGFLPMLVLIPYVYARLRRWLPPNPHSRAAIHALLGILVFGATLALWLLPMLAAVSASGEPGLAEYRDNILFHQTMDRYASPWHHFKPAWYYVAEVIPQLWLPLVLLLPWLVPEWKRRLEIHDVRTLLLLGYAVLVIVFFSTSAAKRGVYVLPALPAFALACAPHLSDLWARASVQKAAFWFTLLFGGSLVAASTYLGWVDAGRGARIAENLHVNPFGLALAGGAAAIAAALGLGRRRGVLGVAALLFVAWQILGWWGYPLLNHGRSGRGLMAAVTRELAANEDMAALDWREQMALHADRPLVHFGYQREPVAERADAVAWLKAAPNRAVIVNARRATPCFDVKRAVPLGHWHEREWYVARRDALAEPLPGECSVAQPSRQFRSLVAPAAG